MEDSGKFVFSGRIAQILPVTAVLCCSWCVVAMSNQGCFATELWTWCHHPWIAHHRWRACMNGSSSLHQGLCAWTPQTNNFWSHEDVGPRSRERCGLYRFLVGTQWDWCWFFVYIAFSDVMSKRDFFTFTLRDCSWDVGRRSRERCGLYWWWCHV